MLLSLVAGLALLVTAEAQDPLPEASTDAPPSAGVDESPSASEPPPLDTQPLDTQPLDARRMDAVAGTAAGAGSGVGWSESYFSFDPFARGRGRVVRTADVALACAGAAPLRDAALSCPIDHQLALRGLPGLLEACTAIGRGGVVPTTALPVPHAATIKAAADARAASAVRMMQDCRFQLSATRSGAQLQVAVPAASGVVEVRVGFRPQLLRPIPGTPPPPVTWLPPVYQPTVPHKREDTARTVDLGVMRPDRGWWRFDLAVEVVDEAGAATRVVMPVDVEAAGPAGPVELGPALEVAVGAGSGNLRLADLPIPPESGRDALTDHGRPGTDRTPRAGTGTDPDALDTVLDACGEAPGGLTSGACRRLRDAGGGYVWPPAGAGPLVGAAARDDVVGLLRQLGERALGRQAALPAAERSWMREDAAMVVAALGGMLEATVRGADPFSALSAWARQRPPALPSGEPFGFFVDDTHRAAPLSSTLYVASLVAASAPEPVRGHGQSGVSVLTLAANFAWTENLPGGLRAPWSGTVHPRLGAADLGWLSAIAETLDRLRLTVAPVWETLRRGGAEVVPSLSALSAQTTAAVLSAAAQVPDQAGDPAPVRAERRATLARLLGRLPDIYGRLATEDLPGAADATLALVDDPGLREGFPALSRTDLQRIGALATLATPPLAGPAVGPSTRSAALRPGLVALAGVGAGPSVSGVGTAFLVSPTAAIAWEHPVLLGRARWAWRLPMLDLGAAWSLGGGVGGPLNWRGVFSPGVQAAWSPAPRALALTTDLRLTPLPPTDAAPAPVAVRLGLGVTRSVPRRP